MTTKSTEVESDCEDKSDIALKFLGLIQEKS